MRAILAIIVIVLFSVPGLLAGIPALRDDRLLDRVQGVPLSVVSMTMLMAALVLLAAVCGAVARARGNK